MPGRLTRKLMLSITAIVILVAAVSGLVNVKIEERQFQKAIMLGADQLSKGIISATWQFMLDDHRDAAYQVMQTIALKQGVDHIRMFNRLGQVAFSTNPTDRQASLKSKTCALCHTEVPPRTQLSLFSRVRIYGLPDGHRRLAMVTPIYNERSCSEASCHAHPERMKVLGVLDVGLSLEGVDAEIEAFKIRVLVRAVIEVLLISLVVLYLIRRFVTHPIDKLIEGTHSVSQMELAKPLDILHSSQELDELAQSFDRMRERLREAIAENSEFTQKLETKVAERTQQLKAAHQKLLQSDRLASLGQLSASVAHEINNPISGVLNLSMLMQRMLKEDGLPANRTEEFRKYLGQVIGETSRVGRIVSDLLAFSRRSKPRRAPADLNQIVRTTFSVVAHKIKLNNVEVEMRLADNLPPVPCDQSQMQQVVLNLCLNAAEACQPRGGGHLLVSTEPGEAAVVMKVSDDGEGIHPENLAKIFDPFFTTKPEGKGVGLGLAVSFGIIQAHGGEIEVESKVGAGSTFTIILPLQQSSQPAEPGEVELARRE